MAARVRTQKENQYLQAEISRLDLMDWTQQRIADHLGITQQAVAYHLKQIKAANHRAVGLDREAAKQRHIAQIELVCSNAWEEIEQLQEDRNRQKRGDQPCGCREDDRQKCEPAPPSAKNHPNPRSMAQIDAAIARQMQIVLECLRDKSKLLGLDAKHDPAPPKESGDDPTDVEPEAVAQEIYELLARISDHESNGSQPNTNRARPTARKRLPAKKSDASK